MEIGKLYKSKFDEIIVECTDVKSFSFSGKVVKSNNSNNPIGYFSVGWYKDSFEEYTLSPTSDQVGGNHYKDCKIQPTEFIHANNIPFIEGNIIKYVIRHRNKNGIEDLKKAKHYIDLLIQFEYETTKVI
jgi:hypothetical protein